MHSRIPSESKVGWPDGSKKKRIILIASLLLVIYIGFKMFVGTFHGPGDPELTKNVHIELVDWHIVGLWVINSPCCWIRVANYNNVPVKNVTIKYKTFGYKGEQLSEGTYTLSSATPADAVVKAGSVKNFIEQYIGLVDLESDMLMVELVSVERQ